MPSPEEKLFSVIQQAEHGPVKPRRQMPWRQRWTLWRTRAAGTIGRFDLDRLIRALQWVVVLLIGVFLLNPIMFHPRLDRLLAQIDQAAATPQFAAPLEGLKPKEDYLQLITQRNPFRPASSPGGASASALQSATVTAMVAQVRLVGIAWGPEPTAMIEEIATQRTHIVKPGEAILGFSVKEILQDRVVLTDGINEVELH